MQFFHDNYALLITLAAIVVMFVGTFIAIPLAKKKGLLTQKNIDAVQEALEMVNLAVKNLNLPSAAASTTTLILRAAEAAVGYVEQTMKFEDNDQKREHATKAAIDFLKHEGIEVTDDLQKLIEVSLQSAVSKLPKTNK